MKPANKARFTSLAAAAMVVVLVFSGCGKKAAESQSTASSSVSSTASLPQSSAVSLPASSSSVVSLPAAAENILLPVEMVLQAPELPNGCECTALAMVLRHLGYPADKVELAYQYLPRQDFRTEQDTLIGGNPEKIYPGDPGNDEGYYCYPLPVIITALGYLLDHDGKEVPTDISGASEEELLQWLSSGHPVILWKTRDDGLPKESTIKKWIIPESGKEYIPYSNLHVVVLYGYDNRYFYINDPLTGQLKVQREQLMQSYQQLNKRAVVVARPGFLQP